MTVIVDYFPFFNEKELLELRINLLKNYVDQFIISEANKSHSGNSKPFICNQLIKELNLPSEKIQVLEIDIPDKNVEILESDYFYSSQAESVAVTNWSRERIQRDALMQHLLNYDDSTIFILSDCDEIIDPKYLPYFISCLQNYSSSFIKVSLVPLEGTANKRLCDDNGVCHWDRSILLCTKQQLANNGSPTKFRGGYNSPISPVWITQNNEIIRDCGWHFSWMGNENRKLIKSQNTIHAENLSVLNNLSKNSMQHITKHTSQYDCCDYDISLLPDILFDLPNVKNFLLPSNFIDKQDITINLFNLYDRFDYKFGTWGWCSNKKANKIINYVIEACSDLHNPVCVEIGVYGGKSLFPIGVALQYLNKGEVYAIDPWVNSDAIIGYSGVHYDFWSSTPLATTIYEIFLSGLEALQIKNLVKIIKTTSDNAPNIENISVLHIDGQHTDQIIRDINKYATAVVNNGYCFVDDVEWSEDTKKSIGLMKSLGFIQIDEVDGCFIYKKILNKC